MTAEKRAIKGGKLSRVFFRARRVINCAGNYSDEVDQMVPRSIDEEKPFTIQPGKDNLLKFFCFKILFSDVSKTRVCTVFTGRGEYIVLEPSKNSEGPMGMVTQVPTKTYQGLYVFKSVYGHFVVGPTNILQDSKEDRGCDVESLATLESHIFKCFPSLKSCKMLGTYVGLRPRTPQSHDYQIRFNQDKSFVTLGKQIYLIK